MPGQFDQRRQANEILNPFEEAVPRLKEYTAQEIATLQSRLDKQLGPEYISTRPGAGGTKVHYVTADKVISLANEVFGFNGWSSAIRSVTIDFVSEVDGKVSLSCSIVCRITLKDGTYHEDIGCGSIENSRSKAGAFDKAKKEAATDALKRAMRNFGKVLGLCLYDKDYLEKVKKVKVEPSRWDVERLHRHHDYVPIKQDPETIERSNSSINLPRRSSGEGEDEFGGNFFDDMDFSHTDDAEMEDTTLVEDAGEDFNQLAVPMQRPAHAAQRPPSNRAQTAPSAHQSLQQQQKQHPQHVLAPGPERPQRPPPQAQTSGYRPPPQNQLPAARSDSKSTPENQINNVAQLGQSGSFDGAQQVGFVNGRSAMNVLSAVAQGVSPTAASVVPPFNPNTPLKRTAALAQMGSGPVRRDDIVKLKAHGVIKDPTAVAVPPAPMGGAQQQTNVAPTKTIQPIHTTAAGAQPQMAHNRMSYSNPQIDTNRRIGMPNQMGMQSPMANRGTYKPPGPAANTTGAKRGPDGQVRQPLTEVASGNIGVNPPIGVGDGLDAKRAKLAS